MLDSDIPDESTLSNLPHSLLLIIIQNLDVASLCSLEQASNWWRRLLKQPTRDDDESSGDDEDAIKFSVLVWEPLFYQRFRLHSKSSLEQQKMQPHLFKMLYAGRHNIEKSAYGGLARLDSRTDETKLLYVTTHFVSVGRDLMDLCWRIWTRNQTNNNHPKLDDGRIIDEDPSVLVVRQMYARSLLRLLHCSSTLEDTMDYLRERRQRVGRQDSVNMIEPRDEDSKDLEELMILVSKIFYDLSPDNINDVTSPLIRQTFDNLADQVRMRLSTSKESSAKETVKALHHVLFEEKNDAKGEEASNPFVGNTVDYYSHCNSLIHTVLRDRTGIPLTLAIIYQCVAWRLGIKANIVGLPGHIVIYLPDMDRYVDVFARGEMMSQEDCQRMVSQFGFSMSPSFLKPLIPELVLQRVLNNLENSFNRDAAATNRHRVMVTALRAILNRPDYLQMEECRNLIGLTWVSAHVSQRGEEWIEW
mmetsp:Transcript_8820/g.11723  ORF Transcript_8820/g.11723 Transcript_8820/m.11723 type:complete len:474 (-) Transcript_8820:34-1455(-)|eukprot:CAMPEP_0198146860 /NCGR_PEP_ID=MMETSP1443-20131203/31837_1 /TAXON_ID=186043 /ORGANISM="Entomoneis sp., Strain CCMP2396" /LENGTH=473 /DNA_ID=CAMNT_0043810957 /DNA_START=77 /DNA_END=1501 /DNA_ORIENTATION=+